MVWSKTEKYSPPCGYRLKLLKMFAREVERAGGAVTSDLLASSIVEAMALSRTVDEDDPNLTCYQSFALSAHAIYIRVAPRNNDVSLRLWEAGFLLAEFILHSATHSPHLFAGKRVVELGAGCGLAGMVAAGSGGAEAVCVTDFKGAAIENMVHNVEINRPYFQACGVEDPEAVVTVSHLDWSDSLTEARTPSARTPSSPALALLRAADVLIAADCAYDVTVIPSLVLTVRAFLSARSTGSTGSTAVAYFATTFRTAETFELFTKELTDCGVEYESIEFDSEKSGADVFVGVWHTCQREGIRMHKFTLRR